MDITLQHICLPDSDSNSAELYCRTEGEIFREKNHLILQKDARIKTNTYMNLLDESAWHRYTGLTEWELRIRIKGQGKIRVYSWSEGKEELLSEAEISSEQTVERIFRGEFQGRMIYFELIARSELEMEQAWYSGNMARAARDIHISLIICTYHRIEAVQKNREIISKSSFFDKSSEYYKGLDLKIIDNGSELEDTDEDGIEIIHNENTGGSGGFARGILESRRESEKYGTTHIVFMDDDVEILEETFYRLYSLLRLIKDEYLESVIGGRMFRMDRKEIQYTASEIWNGGNIIHVGENQDMTRWSNLLDMNSRSGEYSGWWFACFTMDYARENLPLPFFLHCDDVEYGLRHGGTPVILNGIQVWHETYEYRKSLMIEYYDTRNSLIVNTLREEFGNWMDVWKTCKKRLDDHWNKKEYAMAYAVCIGLLDYAKGGEYFLRRGNKRKKFALAFLLRNKWGAALLWRIAFLIYRIFGEKAFSSYKRIKEQY